MRELKFNIIVLATLLTDVCRGECCLGTDVSCPFEGKSCDEVTYDDWFYALRDYAHPDDAYTITLAQDENCYGNL